MPLWIAVAFCVLFAVWKARDGDHQTIDVGVGLLWLFGMLAASGWGILLYRQYHRDTDFDRMFTIAWVMSDSNAKAKVSVDEVLAALRDMRKRYGIPLEPRADHDVAGVKVN